LDGDDSAIGTALRELAEQARGATIDAARTEYDALFIGVARGELVPYASFYLTGFLHERPLARLRADLAKLGLARMPGRSDPEDHIATVCEVMASLIERPGSPAQAEFFGRHLEPWGTGFFSDLERAASAQLYRPVGAIGRLIIELDRQGFAYAAPSPAQTSLPQKGAA
jgi:TorA maturation chaperone TorD